MSGSAGGGRLHLVTRRVAGPELEREYQLEAGREMRDQMGLGQLFGGLLWLGGGLILPQIPPVDTTFAPVVVLALWGVTAIGGASGGHRPIGDAYMVVGGAPDAAAGPRGPGRPARDARRSRTPSTTPWNADCRCGCGSA